MLANQLFELGWIISANHCNDCQVPVADLFGRINIGPVFIKEQVQFKAELFGKKNNLCICTMAE